MKKARYSEEQIVRILREADRDPVADVAKRHGVSEQSTRAGASVSGGLGWTRCAGSRK